MGAILVEEDRVKFDRFVKKTMRKRPINDTKEMPAKSNECPTSKETLFDYFFDRNEKIWVAWEWIVPSYIHNITFNYCDHFVPTASTIQVEYILKLMNNVRALNRRRGSKASWWHNGFLSFSQVNCRALFIGKPSSGKSSTLLNFLRNVDQKTHVIIWYILYILIDKRRGGYHVKWSSVHFWIWAWTTHSFAITTFDYNLFKSFIVKVNTFLPFRIHWK